MPWAEAPKVDFREERKYRWSCGHLGLKESALFGELHERFNTVPMFIQDPEAFHCDVDAIARQSSTQEEFFASLQARREERLEELNQMRRRISILFILGYSTLSIKQEIRSVDLSAFASLDSLVAFLASLLGPDEHGNHPREDMFDTYAESQLRKLKKNKNTITDGDAGPEPTASISSSLQPHAIPSVSSKASKSQGRKKRKAERRSLGNDKRKRSDEGALDESMTGKRQRVERDSSPKGPSSGTKKDFGRPDMDKLATSRRTNSIATSEEKLDEFEYSAPVGSSKRKRSRQAHSETPQTDDKACISEAEDISPPTNTKRRRPSTNANEETPRSHLSPDPTTGDSAAVDSGHEDRQTLPSILGRKGTQGPGFKGPCPSIASGRGQNPPRSGKWVAGFIWFQTALHAQLRGIVIRIKSRLPDKIQIRSRKETPAQAITITEQGESEFNIANISLTSVYNRD
ncbi:hypothetical protein FDECE_11504 [Fusarium decemcellulare]|nr:hypothetical protein FDECE_11504 [Fusarium decemcellulare]